jgi:cobalt-zinc-cadmium efflux system outer membrane protein
VHGIERVKTVLLRSLPLACALLAPSRALAAEAPLPSPLDAPTVVRLARERRPETTAARARWAAAAERPKVVAALPDPMFAVSADQVPFAMNSIMGSITVQQEFPLSGVLGDRRRAAEAEAQRWGADVRRVALDVELEALGAFYMLAERRGETPILEEQIDLVGQVVGIARVHLASGQGMEADVMRLDNERARLVADRDALAAEVRAAEAMLDTSLARSPDERVPALAWGEDPGEPPHLDELARQAFAQRPELEEARAERARAGAEIDAMESMYTPMALVRAGPAYQTPEAGFTLMVGVTLPIFRERLGAGVVEARAMSAMANADEDAMQRMILGAIASAREAVIAARTRWLALDSEIVPRAHLVVESTVGAFATGQAAMIVVLGAARDLRDVRVDAIMARARLGQAEAKLQREVGDMAPRAH